MCKSVCVYASGYNITYLSLSLWLSLLLSAETEISFYPVEKKKKTLTFFSTGFILLSLKPSVECRFEWFNWERSTDNARRYFTAGHIQIFFCYLFIFYIYL